MAATENSRGKQKEWVFLSVFYDWEFNYNTKKKSSRFILPLCLKKKKRKKAYSFKTVPAVDHQEYLCIV